MPMEHYISLLLLASVRVLRKQDISYAVSRRKVTYFNSCVEHYYVSHFCGED